MVWCRHSAFSCVFLQDKSDKTANAPCPTPACQLSACRPLLPASVSSPGRCPSLFPHFRVDAWERGAAGAPWLFPEAPRLLGTCSREGTFLSGGGAGTRGGWACPGPCTCRSPSTKGRRCGSPREAEAATGRVSPLASRPWIPAPCTLISGCVPPGGHCAPDLPPAGRLPAPEGFSVALCAGWSLLSTPRCSAPRFQGPGSCGVRCGPALKSAVDPRVGSSPRRRSRPACAWDAALTSTRPSSTPRTTANSPSLLWVTPRPARHPPCSPRLVHTWGSLVIRRGRAGEDGGQPSEGHQEANWLSEPRKLRAGPEGSGAASWRRCLRTSSEGLAEGQGGLCPTGGQALNSRRAGAAVRGGPRGTAAPRPAWPRPSRERGRPPWQRPGSAGGVGPGCPEGRSGLLGGGVLLSVLTARACCPPGCPALRSS
ncbi:uncharacterized protein AAES06_016515 [Glossophaga mutica]